MSPAEIVSFARSRCLGPAALWPCALPLGHPGDHSRFAPEPTVKVTVPESLEAYVVKNLQEIKPQVDKLIKERNDLLEACRQARHRLLEIESGTGIGSVGTIEELDAVIALAEGQ